MEREQVQNAYATYNAMVDSSAKSAIKPPAVSESSPLGAQYGNLNGALHELRQRMDTLNDRLTPVLASSRLTNGAIDNEPQAGLGHSSPFADSLLSDTVRVRDLIVMVSDIIDRLEI